MLSNNMVGNSKNNNFSSLNRPTNQILRLQSLLLPYSEFVTTESTLLVSTKNNGGYLFVIPEGEFEIYRCVDDLRVNIGAGPAIVGVQELFCSVSVHYVRMLNNSKAHAIDLSVARECIRKENAWADVAEILAYYLRRALERDEYMVKSKSYDIICYCLKKYLLHKKSYISRGIGIVNYITSSSKISRSMAHAVVSQLSKGGYICISNGKLISINHLPDRY